MFLLAYPVEPAKCGDAVLFIQNIPEKEYQCGDVVYVKTETKLFAQNAYFAHFLEGHLSPLHSCLAQESRMFRHFYNCLSNLIIFGL